jgi:hypothetical protein
MKDALVTAKKRKPHSRPALTTPSHEKLPWPGLRAKDHLSRVVARTLKEAKETKENEVWAENQIARVLDYVPPETGLRLLFREARRRRKPLPRLAKSLLGLLEAVERAGGIIELGVGTCAFQGNLDWLELEDVVLETRDALRNLNNAAMRLRNKKGGVPQTPSGCT